MEAAVYTRAGDPTRKKWAMSPRWRWHRRSISGLGGDLSTTPGWHAQGMRETDPHSKESGGDDR